MQRRPTCKPTLVKSVFASLQTTLFNTPPSSLCAMKTQSAETCIHSYQIQHCIIPATHPQFTESPTAIPPRRSLHATLSLTASSPEYFHAYYPRDLHTTLSISRHLHIIPIYPATHSQFHGLFTLAEWEDDFPAPARHSQFYGRFTTSTTIPFLPRVWPSLEPNEYQSHPVSELVGNGFPRTSALPSLVARELSN